MHNLVNSVKLVTTNRKERFAIRKVLEMINVVALSGNVCADPRKFGTEEHPAIGFTLAVNVPVKDNGNWTEDTMYVSCVMFGRRVVKLADIIKKGMPLVVSGSVKPERYTNKDGVRIETFGVTVNEVQLPRREQKEDSPWN